MTDPLSLLRLYTIDNLPIRKENDKIIFDEHGYSWPKTVKTNYVIFRKDGSPKEYYTLECLLYFLENVHIPHPKYCEQARADNVPFVRRPDRKALLAYLNGKTDTSASIDKSASVETPNTVAR